MQSSSLKSMEKTSALDQDHRQSSSKNCACQTATKDLARPGETQAKHGLYQHLHNNVFFYSGLLLPMTIVKIRTHLHTEVTSSNAFQGTILWLLPKKHCMSSPTDSRRLQGINSFCRIQATVMSTHWLFLAHVQ